MVVWVAAILAAVFLAGGAVSLRVGIKNGKRLWKTTGMVLLLACVLCVVYLAAALLLLGGIE